MITLQWRTGNYNEFANFIKELGTNNVDGRSRLRENLRIAIRDELTEIELRTVMYYYYDAFVITKIAELMGVNPSTVSRNLKRARGKLGRALKYGAAELLEQAVRDKE